VLKLCFMHPLKSGQKIKNKKVIVLSSHLFVWAQERYAVLKKCRKKNIIMD